MRQEGGHETTFVLGFVSRCKHAEDKFFSPNRAPARQLNCRGELGIPTAVTIWAFLIGSQFCQISSPHNLSAKQLQCCIYKTQGGVNPPVSHHI